MKQILEVKKDYNKFMVETIYEPWHEPGRLLTGQYVIYIFDIPTRKKALTIGKCIAEQLGLIFKDKTRKG